MPALARSFHRLGRLLGRWREDAEGASSVEFAIAVPMLLTLGFYGTEVAWMASVNMEISQIALSVADNASRLEQTNNSAVTPTVTEVEVATVLNAGLRQGGPYNFQQNGRIILSSLEYDTTTGKQWIHWQRCIGNLNVASAYGAQGAKFFNGTGTGATKMTATTGQAVMFVEVYYNYAGLFGNMFVSQMRMSHEAAFLTRDSRNLGAALSGTSTTPC